ncbi:MAG: SEC-C metal-binding domain-containing protein [Deltaproteobacteria bacterium]|nr:SEC-C metal-binding domain-containing protein [Deltaproteobacteria bacterium]
MVPTVEPVASVGTVSSTCPRPRLCSASEDREEMKRLAPPQPRHVDKIGRNDSCPCGSGKKYKKCCGMN